MTSIPGSIIKNDGKLDYKKIKSGKVFVFDELHNFLKKKLNILMLDKSGYNKFTKIIMHPRLKKEFDSMTDIVQTSPDIYELKYNKDKKMKKILYNSKTKQNAYLLYYIDTTYRQLGFEYNIKSFLEPSNFFEIVMVILMTGNTKDPSIGVYKRHYLLNLEKFHSDIIIPPPGKTMDLRTELNGRIAAVKKYDGFRFFNAKYKKILATAKAFLRKQRQSAAFKKFAKNIVDKPAGRLYW